jgi:predicted RNase H-like nuclease (RuvC/YqgF family)
MTNPCERHCEATAFKIEIKNLKWEVTQKDTEIHRLKAERDEIYGLLSAAHTELRSQLEYGYHVPAIKSTLISIGQYAPKLKAKMDELQAKMGDKHD